MTQELVRVIGHIDGSLGKEEKALVAFRNIFPRLERFEFRPAGVTMLLLARKNISTKWHQDCNSYPEKFIFWSNEVQTEVQDLNGRILPPIAPGDIVLINNRLTRHRAPPNASITREFVRIQLMGDNYAMASDYL